MKNTLCLLLVLLIVVDASIPFKKVVVLMMENHSFDHLLGYVPGIGHLDGTQGNFDVEGNFIKSEPGCSTNDPDHPHAFPSAVEMLYYPHSRVTEADPAGQGFIVTNFPDGAKPEAEKEYMRSYGKDDPKVAALQTLAKNFVVCNRWFASLPGPTVPNRLFVHTASSGGYAGGYWITGEETVPESLTSIFEVMEDNNRSWGIYSMDYSLQLPSQDLPFVKAHPEKNKLGLWQFYQDISLGQQPDYSFLIPSLYVSQHPGQGDGGVKAGDDLIRWVYETIRQNEQAWKDTLLIITYDEWGGWYDSVPPKGKVPPPPAVFGNSWPPGPNPAFNFTKLGVRVPAILVSAWLDHAVSSTVYEHSSIPASLKILFDLKGPGPDGFLTVRDQTANTPLHHIHYRSTPRKDLYWLHEGFGTELKENIRKEQFSP